MAKKYDEAEIAKQMKILGCSREEVIEMWEYDDEVDHTTHSEYDLSPEEQARVDKARRKVEHSNKGEKKKVERKPNELKEAIVAEIAELLGGENLVNAYESVEITNKNRMIAFSVGDKRFELTLIEKRPPKNK